MNFCSNCGEKTINFSYPYECKNCKEMHWGNPKPAAVAIQVVEEVLDPNNPSSKEQSIVLIRRGIEPGKGELALPGGYIDLGETWEHAVLRELYEETGIKHDYSSDVNVIDVHSNSSNQHVLIFGVVPKLLSKEDYIYKFIPNNECTEIIFLNLKDIPYDRLKAFNYLNNILAFDTHAKAIIKYIFG